MRSFGTHQWFGVSFTDFSASATDPVNHLGNPNDVLRAAHALRAAHVLHWSAPNFYCPLALALSNQSREQVSSSEDRPLTAEGGGGRCRVRAGEGAHRDGTIRRLRREGILDHPRREAFPHREFPHPDRGFPHPEFRRRECLHFLHPVACTLASRFHRGVKKQPTHAAGAKT